jgi:hypothetical protein
MSLKNELKMLTEQIVILIDQKILAGGLYNNDEMEFLINHLGGMLQIIIIRVETDSLDEVLT